MTLRIFIADDETPARERMKELLGDIAADLPSAVVGEARDGLATLDAVPESGAQVLLLDIQMPGMGGLEVARHLMALENIRERLALFFDAEARIETSTPADRYRVEIEIPYRADPHKAARPEAQ